MSMSVTELERALRSLRLSGMIAALETRALQVAHHEMDFIEAFSCLVQDELDRRRSRLLDRRFAHSGLPERKDLKDFDWGYNARLPKRAVLELATLKFIRRTAHRSAGTWREPTREGDRSARSPARLPRALSRSAPPDRRNSRSA